MRRVGRGRKTRRAGVGESEARGERKWPWWGRKLLDKSEGKSECMVWEIGWKVGAEEKEEDKEEG